MTESQLLDLATSAVPERLRSSPRAIVRRVQPTPQGAPIEGADQGDAKLHQELEDMLQIKLPEAPAESSDSVDVAFQETTELGVRTTVVQIREGQVQKVIGQA